MANRFWVIGIGPGTLDYLVPAAVRAVAESDLLIGGPRALALVQHLGKPGLPITGDLNAVVQAIKANLPLKKIAVLLSGDPGFYSLVPYLQRHFTPDQMVIIPGISSLQLAFARLGRTWERARLVSLHGRSLAELESVLSDPGTTALLTDPVNSPARVARYLLDSKIVPRRISVLSNLGYENEMVLEAQIVEIANLEHLSNCVMVIDIE